MRSFVCLCVLLVGGATAWADANAWVDENNQIVVSLEGQPLLGLEFQSVSGSLIPNAQDDPGPFRMLLSNRPTLVTFGAFRAVELAGDYKLPLWWDPAGQQDVLFQYGTPTDYIPLSPLQGHQDLRPEPTVKPSTTDSGEMHIGSVCAEDGVQELWDMAVIEGPLPPGYHPCESTSAVPEPAASTGVLLALCVLAMGNRRPRR